MKNWAKMGSCNCKNHCSVKCNLYISSEFLPIKKGKFILS